MLSVRGLTKQFSSRDDAGAVTALRDIGLDVSAGEFFALLGPSGCGKTTLLQCIAGLETPTAGKIAIGERLVADGDAGVFVPANQRGLGMVFQSYAIWPHMSVYDNVAFPLVHGGRRVRSQDVRTKVMAALERVQLTAYAERLAPHLSGGQQQRVALARAIVHEPPLLLLDEPLSNLDARLRDEMRVELRALVKGLGITTIFVTHDQVEAMGMADRIALLRAGQIMQTGTPEDFYFRPASAFAAHFVGHCNALACIVRAQETRHGVTHTQVDTPVGPLISRAPTALQPGMRGQLLIRPQAISAGSAPSNENHLAGKVRTRSFLGERVDLDIEAAGTMLRMTVSAYDSQAIADGSITLHLAPDRCIIVPGDT